MNHLSAVGHKQRQWQRSLLEDASLQATYTQALTGVIEAVACLQERLGTMGYPIHQLRQVPTIHDRNILKDLEKAGVAIPTVLKLFWTIVGGLSFVDLENHTHRQFWCWQGLTDAFGDGVLVHSLTYTGYSDFVLQFWREQEEDEESREPRIPISHDGFGKDGYSGGGPYTMFTEDSWHGQFCYFNWWGATRPITCTHGPLDLVSYLRVALLECGGFPGFRGNREFEEMRGELVEGLPLF